MGGGNGFLYMAKKVIRGNFLALLLSWTVWRFSMRISGPYRSPFIIQVLGGTPTIIGIISSIRSIIRLIVFIPGGYLADSVGRKRIVSTMTFFMATASLIYVFALDWRWALAATIFQSISSIYMPALRAITADSLPPEYRGIGFALQSYLPSLPAIFSPMIGAILIENYGYDFGIRLAFGIQFICGIAAASIRTIFLKETLKVEEKKEEKFNLTRTFSETFKTLIEIPLQLKCIIIASIIGDLGMNVVDQYRILYATNIKGLEVFSWGTILTITNGVTIVIGLITGILLDKYGKRKISILTGIIFTISTILFINAENFETFLLAMIMISLSRFGVSSGLRALQADLTPREKRGKVNAAGMMISQLITIPLAYIAGAGYEMNPITPFIMDLIFASITVTLLITVIREPKKRYY